MNSETLLQTLKYIEEREASLGSYSTKLRRNVQIIFAQLNPKLCRVCGAGAYRTDSGECVINTVPQGHTRVPGLGISIDVKDPVSFYEAEDGDTAYLAIRNHEFGVVWVGSDGQESKLVTATELPRTALKALVRSGRIWKFLDGVSQLIDQEAGEYRQASELAEKLAEAVKEQ